MRTGAITVFQKASENADDRDHPSEGIVGWVGREFAAERSRWQLWLPVSFGAGIGLYFLLPSEPPLWSGLAALSLCLILGLWWRRQVQMLLPVLFCAVASLGFAVAQWNTVLLTAPIVSESKRAVTLEGQVYDLERKEGAYRVVLRHLMSESWTPDETPKFIRVRLWADAAAPLEVGSWISLRAVLRPPPGPVAPGVYDFARRAFFDQLGGVGYAVSRPEILGWEVIASRSMASSGFWETHSLWWSALRHRLSERILAALPGQSGAVAAALMTGERGAISEKVIEDMRAAGLAHLLAISGLHMGLIGGLIFFLLRFLLACVPPVALRFPIKKWAAVAALIGSGFYLLLVGATIPSQRAFIMVGLVFVGVLADRRAISLRLVAWAAFFILILSPQSLLSASFQLSFAAVIALVAFYESWSLRRIGRSYEATPLHKLGFYLSGVFATSAIAVAATSAFAAYHFNRLALYGLLANLVAVPLTAFWVMPWALVAFLLMPFGLEKLALIPMGWGLDVILGVAAAVAAWPGAQLLVPAMSLGSITLITFGGLWLCLWRRRWRWWGVVPILLGLASLPLTPPPHVWVEGEGRLVAFRDSEDVFWRSTGSRARFEAEQWQRRAGLSQREVWPRQGAALGGDLRCDILACIFRQHGRVIAFVFDSRALEEDCHLADVVISLEPVFGRYCDAVERVIDRFDLWRNGSHAIWLNDDNIRIESVEERRGRRPWVLSVDDQ
ncbi:MAG: ComEC/Rec2 family competence protein [Pseudomonadota bacterium]